MQFFKVNTLTNKPTGKTASKFLMNHFLLTKRSTRQYARAIVCSGNAYILLTSLPGNFGADGELLNYSSRHKFEF